MLEIFRLLRLLTLFNGKVILSSCPKSKVQKFKITPDTCTINGLFPRTTCHFVQEVLPSYTIH